MRKLLPGLCVMMVLASSVAFGQSSTPTPRIAVPDLNGRAVTLVKPAFPETAVAAQADGASVSVFVIVGEDGEVLLAKCSLNCHPMLKDAAELAAATSKFLPLLNKVGQAVSYEGTLLYTFVVDRVNWFRFGTALESTRQFDNISLGPVAQMLSPSFATEKAKLIGLDAKRTELETRWKVIREVENSLKEKLKPGEVWRFEIGMALRLVTFWTMVGGPANRVEMQKAIDGLPKAIAAAPDDIPATIIEALKAVSMYRVTTEIPERELRQAIVTLTRNIRIEQ